MHYCVSVHVCFCVCSCVYMLVYMRAFIYGHLNVCTYIHVGEKLICACECIRVCLHVKKLESTCACMSPLSEYVCVFVCVRVCLCVCNVYSVLVYEREYALMYANVCVCVCAYISVFVFFVFLHRNNERECLYTYIYILVQNVYMCK